MPSPSFTASCTFWMPFATTSLPEVSFTMESADSTGTPDAIRVPSVRPNREIAVFEIIGPNSGILYLTQSTPYFPAGICTVILYRMMMPMMPARYHHHCCTIVLLTSMTNTVMPGSGSPSSSSAKIFVKFGTMKIMRPITAPMAMVRTTDG